ncbi:MAG: putative protein tyrosine phosphatase [Acidimicrobiales bacterium]|jgi:predicted protein tyrosine phosphatase
MHSNKVSVLGIEDDYQFMDRGLVELFVQVLIRLIEATP